MNEIIENEYAKKKGSNNNNWFWEESIKYGKGYSKTDEYLKAIAKNTMEQSNNSANVFITLFSFLLQIFSISSIVKLAGAC